jgi:L-threonylcarbamoyladenylate synthase
MARIDISKGFTSEDVKTAVAALKDGFVIVVALENSYALAANAFFHDAVRAMHVLRGDELGVAAQVAIASAKNIDGIARNISDGARKLMQNFWPGLLSLNLKPQAGLSWDLGDAQQLDCISVRVPKSDFFLEVLKESGPLAIASAARVGESAICDPIDLAFTDAQVSAIFDAGVLSAGVPSTVVDFTGQNGRITRVGAISKSEITALVSDIYTE